MLECFSAIIAARDLINEKLSLEVLPETSYRISADYGQVEVGKTIATGMEDLFGPTVNICSKINTMAEPNGTVIGSDLYQIVKRFSFAAKFEFREKGAYSIGFKQSYPVFSVKSKLPYFPFSEINLLPRPTSEKNHDTTSSEPAFNIVSLNQTGPVRRHNIMVVDDEPDVLALFKSFLEQDGNYVVEAYSDSSRALQAFARSEPRRFDLIILDIRMPSLNGMQLYQRIKSIDPHVKVIFLTALDAAEELVSVLEGIKAVDVLRKPIERKHFLQRVQASIHHSLLPSSSSSSPSLLREG